MQLNHKSHYIDVDNHKLHLRRIWQKENAPVVVMFHGVIEDGAIFYKDDKKGLANFLARNGFDVYVVDFRGKGGSRPLIQQDSNHDQYDVIARDIPSVMRYICSVSQQPLHVVCHSWGGVLFSAAYIRAKGYDNRIASIVCFGTKRRVAVWNRDRLLKVSLFWNNLAPLLATRKGYLDAKYYRIGAAPETKKFIQQSVNWVKKREWRDPSDNYNYTKETKKVSWPPTWYLTGVNDHSLGHADDVYRFLKETQHPNGRFTLLSKQNGNLVDYDHINILTHKLAEQDHFLSVLEWLIQHSQTATTDCQPATL